MFYDYSKLLSYGALISFIIGERGVGKTYGAIKYVINNFLKTGNQFVYVRRYATELETSAPKFFDAIIENNEFEGHEFKVKTSKKLTRFYIDGEICGYALPLSTAMILKSTSFAKVKTIIFDEFIIATGTYHYLKNEVHHFLDLIETIARLRDIRVFCLANALTISNPYFNYWNLSLPYKSDFKTFRNGLIVVNYIRNEEYRKAKKASRFGQLIEGTEYGKYAIDNEFLLDDKNFIQKRPSFCTQYSTIIINNKNFGVWRDKRHDMIYISQDYDPTNPCCFAIDIKSHDEHTILVNARNSPWFKIVIDAYRMGLLRFENQNIKNEVMTIVNKIITI